MRLTSHLVVRCPERPELGKMDVRWRLVTKQPCMVMIRCFLFGAFTTIYSVGLKAGLDLSGSPSRRQQVRTVTKGHVV